MVGKWEKVDADRSIRFATRRRRRSEDGRERHLRVDAAVDRDGARLLDGVIFASRKGTPLSANNFLKRARDTSVMWFAGFDFHAQHPPALDYFLQQRG